MEKFKIVPEIYEYMTFKEFLEEFPIHTDDLLLTQRFIYAPFIEPFHLNCHIVFQEDFGEGEPSDEMVDAVLQKTDRLDYNRVIAVGGGTVIDIAKLLSLKTFHYTEEIFNESVKN